MSPLDDELRAALHGRASTLTPSPDPLAGIERRALGIRRRRSATAVACTALAVAAVALAVPLLTPAAAPRTLPPAVAPSVVQQSPAPDAAAYALDPASPWAYRGAAVPAGLLDAARRTFSLGHAVAEQAVTMTPLYGQAYEPSGSYELVFLAVVQGDPTPRWGVVRTSEAGPDLLLDDDLPQPAVALAAALPGDEVGRLLVVAAPQVASVDYAPEGAAAFTNLVDLAAGVAVGPLDGDPATDRFRVVAPGGQVLTQGPAPDLGDRSGGSGPAGEPGNLLLTWPQRGDAAAGPPDQEVEDRFRAAVPGRGPASYRRLFSGSLDSGVRFTVGQAWVDGQPARTVGFATGGTQGEQLFLGPVTPDRPPVLALLVCCAPGTTTETLVVVPQPGTGQVLYDDDAAGAFRAVGQGQDQLDGVVLVDRDPRAQADRLQLLDGDGNLDRPAFTGPVLDLLCAEKECG